MTSNLFDAPQGSPQGLPQELFETLLRSANVRIERIISFGHGSPDGFWYDQEESEWVVVLQGKARLWIEGVEIALGPGEFLNIPAHQKHRVEWTAPGELTIWLAVFYRDSRSTVSSDTVTKAGEQAHHP